MAGSSHRSCAFARASRCAWSSPISPPPIWPSSMSRLLASDRLAAIWRRKPWRMHQPAASDWWSLGIILLELVTDGACFAGVHDRAFLLHLVTRGVAVPKDIEPGWRNCLRAC